MNDNKRQQNAIIVSNDRKNYYNEAIGIDEMIRKPNNPFNITFGKIPNGLIVRYEIDEQIISSLRDENMNEPLYIFVGSRGIGKTVAITNIAKQFKDEKDWLVVDLNPHLDMLEQLAGLIYQKGQLKKLFLKSEFSFSFQGLSFSIRGDKPVDNILSLIDLMLSYLKKKNVKVLILIDEVVSNKNMKIFAHSYQSFIREDYPTYLLMTGLYENVSRLENDKSLTFLYRAPKIYLNNLNIRAVAYSYMDLLKMSEMDALEAAKTTKGYAFGYQLLGYILYNLDKKKVDAEVIREFDLALDEKAYSKIYSELTALEKEIVNAIAKGNNSNEQIMKEVKIKSNVLMLYKKALSKKGVIDISKRGESYFSLPRFKEFVLFQMML